MARTGSQHHAQGARNALPGQIHLAIQPPVRSDQHVRQACYALPVPHIDLLHTDTQRF